ncbi:MAG: PKD domain-containing protein [Candidatus Thermoplasmatota archaeon]
MHIFDGIWHIEKVDEEGDVGAYASIAIDLNGYPHISYVDRSNLDLKYAKKINYKPEKPQKPEGRIFAITGKKYFYETVSSDFDGDKIRYGWDWNNDNIVDEWTEFYESGIKIKITHSWNKMGIYKIKVIAEDENGFLSNWSDEKRIYVFKSMQILNILKEYASWN